MKKQAKGIIALSAVLAAMLGGGFAYMKLNPSETEGHRGGSSSSSAPELLATEANGQGTVLVSDGTEDAVVKSVTVKNSSGELNVIMKSAPDKENNKGAVYTLDGYTDLDVNTAMVGTLANNANGMQAAALVAEGCTDLAKYGLASPSAEVELTYESGTKVKFLVGDTAPSSDNTYLMVDDGRKDVYTVNTSTVANYSNSSKDFIEKTILEKPADDEMPEVESLRIEREDIDYDILIKYDRDKTDAHAGGTSSPHKLVEPTDSYLTVEKATDIISGMFGLYASDIHALHCTEADIAEAGLDKPFCKVTMDCDDGKSHVLLLGKVFADENGGKCAYGMLEGGKVIYTVSESSAKWLTVTPSDICSRMIIASYVWNITELSVSGGGESAEFKIEPKDKDNIPESPKAEDFNVTKDGKEFDSERYRLFYSFLVSTNGEEFALDAPVPEGEPEVSVTIKDEQLGKTIKYDFYEDTFMRSLIVIDGKSKYYCTKSYVDTLKENIKRISTGEDYITTW
ncbi:DUF4340 domain-containing protein [Ruminococcus flavefaciens]|uniref:DUF4340 domain-containing protein n=1 Tax=Ruminococcus flavefaciens TaxID=1265 RepID=A0A1K1NSC5_RUMFL|nr:DUF4340 domain-containing protein [Ruminococcus flavefaciens]SFW38376.1 protein of unknown function [Ruminococcus flavefaciens]